MTYSVISSVRQRVDRILRQQRCWFINQNPAAAVTRREGAGPPPRSFADDAHDCIMVAIRTRIDRIQGCGATSAPRDGELPSDQVVPIFKLRDHSCR
jgi:hypothetical protein